MNETDAVLTLGNQTFAPGTRGVAEIPIGRLMTHEMVHLRVHVIRGKKPGPRLFVSAAIHGDEVNGVQVARQILRSEQLKRLRGDLLVIPVTNPPAFAIRSRYMPDRRDLNRLFPGSSGGSFGSRLARVINDEIVQNCTHGIELHTGAIMRPNLPQLRVSPDRPTCLEMARAFDPPVIVVSSTREGSLRYEMNQQDKSVIVYEGGEARILDAGAIRVGARGVMNVMRWLDMLPAGRSVRSAKRTPTVTSYQSVWVRAPVGGVLLPQSEMGKAVSVGEIMGTIADPYSGSTTVIECPQAGLIIGQTREALVDEGDGLFHIACLKDPETAEEKIVINEDYHDVTFGQGNYLEADGR